MGADNTIFKVCLVPIEYCATYSFSVEEKDLKTCRKCDDFDNEGGELALGMGAKVCVPKI